MCIDRHVHVEKEERLWIKTLTFISAGDEVREYDCLIMLLCKCNFITQKEKGNCKPSFGPEYVPDWSTKEELYQIF